jgi:hypothetical protein
MVAGPAVAAVPTKKRPWGASALLGGGTRNYFEARHSAQPTTILMNVSALRALHEGDQEVLSFGMEAFGAHTWDRYGSQPGLFGLGVSLVRECTQQETTRRPRRPRTRRPRMRPRASAGVVIASDATCPRR